MKGITMSKDDKDAEKLGLFRMQKHAERMHATGRITFRELDSVRSAIAQHMLDHHQSMDEYVSARANGNLSKLLSELGPRDGQSAEEMQRERGAAVRKVNAGMLVDAYEAGAIDDKDYVARARDLGIVPEAVSKIKEDGKAATELWSHQRDPDAELPEAPERIPAWSKTGDDKVDEEYVLRRRAEDAAAYRERTGGLDAPDNTPAKRHPDRDPDKRVTKDPTDMSVGEYAKARRDDSVDLVVKSEPAGESASASEAA
jgi:hypothetical protein